jgi:hypothetical protein
MARELTGIEAVMEEVVESSRYSAVAAGQSVRKHGPLSLTLVVSVVATVALVALLATGALNTFSGVDQLARASIPGAVSVSAPRAGEMIVYFEGTVPPSLNELGLRVSGPDGAILPTDPHGPDLRYDHDDRVGTAVASFAVPAPGRYRVSTRATEPGARLAVGGDLGAAIMLTDLATVGLGLAAITGLAAVVALLLRRSRRRSRRRSAAVTLDSRTNGRVAVPRGAGC